MNKQLLQFVQHHFQTRFRFRNAFESRLTVSILGRLIREHPESLLLTRQEVERLTGCSLDDPVLQREYFPARTITLLETALDDLISLSISVTHPEGRVRYPLFRSVQIDQVCERIVFNLNLDALPQLTVWAEELRRKQKEF